ncbi:unnamed protein product [Hyaloperonospora brassicae]|uniref:RxLR effector protein n=1 Tax=Hyaloperonospora brassicae TaxID=162125 RepID=A0AAV0TJD9_HYABA|nr:unnamed protein product [Hyaloperonospora brassicae]CAI5721432.1 unnamed protein product [Hyaloperonospora brassicae]CAI5721436.1 unnamed protein product [Hyaloperonospora brassicae]
MRIHYVALVAAAALIASTHGHQAVRDSTTLSSLRTTTEAENQPGAVDGKTNRFLTSDDNFEPLAVTSTGDHASIALQKGDGHDRQLRQLLDFNSDDEARSFFGKKKHKKRRHRKHKNGDSSDSSESKNGRKKKFSLNPFKW